MFQFSAYYTLEEKLPTNQLRDVFINDFRLTYIARVWQFLVFEVTAIKNHQWNLL